MAEVVLDLSEYEALKRDAERYRWLRSPERLGYWRVQKWEVEEGEWNPDRGKGDFETLSGDALDHEVDFARAGMREWECSNCHWTNFATAGSACANCGTAFDQSNEVHS